MENLNLQKYQKEIAILCKKWRIKELSIFGSALRSDFHPKSDIDILINFDLNANWGFFDLVHIEEDFERLFKRRVDLVTRRGIESSQNFIRKNNILKEAKVIYGAG